MNTFIIGCGGVGGFFGGLLAKAGKKVTFVTRKEECRIIKKNGLRVKSAVGNFTIKSLSVLNDIRAIKNPDLILVTVKSYDLEGVAKKLSSVVTGKTIVITFQNGIDNDLTIQKHVKGSKVYPGIAYIVASKTSPGVIEQISGARKLIFGDRKKPENEGLNEAASFLRGAGIDAECSQNISLHLWKKYIFIIPYAGMTSICRSPIGTIMADSTASSLYRKCLEEAAAVARAMGVHFSKTVIHDTLSYVRKHDPSSKSSMLVDIENGRRTEIETLHGTLVRLAKQNGIPVPVNSLIYSAVKLWGGRGKKS
ncbi:2-dehydropantoate 2-reductase [Candidatus Woesearchaeota archaeon]|nr:2-dehydropantoate 2-reductase [Candidatus Woesearchaeota archaeon]